MNTRTLVAAGLALLALVAALGGYTLGVGPRSWFHHDARADGSTVRVYGNIEIRDAQLAFNGAEHIAEVLVEEGDRVSIGDRLAILQTDRLQQMIREAESGRNAQRAALRRLENGTRAEEIEQSRAELRAAEATLANAELEAARLEEARLGDAAGRQELDDALSLVDVERARLEVKRAALALAIEGPRREDIDEARARLEESEASLAGLGLELADSVLVAPAPGIVQSRILEPGEYATPDRPVLTLALTEKKWVRAYLPEPQLGRVTMGMPAAVRSDSFPEVTFTGQIGFISPTAEFTPKTVQTTELRTKLVYEIRINVEDPGDRLRLGQPVTVDIGRFGNEDAAGNAPEGAIP